MSVGEKGIERDEEIMVCIEFPEFAIDDVKVFVGEEGAGCVDVLFVFEVADCLEEAVFAEFAESHFGDGVVGFVIEDAGYDCFDCDIKEFSYSLSRKMTISSFLTITFLKNNPIPQKLQSRMIMDNI